MRGLFGQILHETREIKADKVSEREIFDTPGRFKSAAQQLDGIASREEVNGAYSAGIDPQIVDLVSDIALEADELAAGVRSSNDPSTRQLRMARLKTTVFHGAILLGRLIYRVGGAALSHVGSVASIIGVIEIAHPGTVRAAYELLRAVVPDLPPIPPI
ncbi:hypothetical protein GCM10011392_01470 [Wenxinia marina]|nr:hypothetical protein GCM10011392_01470 [Wenxinia marina]